jgi:hypothetical protein
MGRSLLTIRFQVKVNFNRKLLNIYEIQDDNIFYMKNKGIC